MTIEYNVIPRRDPRDPTAPERYFPSVKSTSRLSLRELGRKVSAMSTVSPIDTLAVIESMLYIIPEQLMEGKIVELGDFGRFWLRLDTEGADTPEEVTRENVTRVRASFRPGMALKEAMLAAPGKMRHRDG